MKWHHCFLLFAVTCFTTGCGGDSKEKKEDGKEAKSDEKEYTIAVIPKGTTHEFWKSVHYGAEQAAKEYGNVKILWKGPLKESDRKNQIAVVQNFITKKVDGICLAPLDSQSLVEHVLDSKENGIPVVIFDSGLDGDKENYISYVATNNYKGGEIAAREMGKLLNKTGNVILLRYTQGSESTLQREEGFLATLTKEFPDIRVISSDEYSGTTPEESFAKARQVLLKHSENVDEADMVNGIFAVCEPNATGTLNALRELELVKKVKFVAFDPNAELVRGLEDGEVHGIVLQDPVTMGYEAVKAMMESIKGEEVKPRIETGEYIATPENMATEEMEKLLNPAQYEDD